MERCTGTAPTPRGSRRSPPRPKTRSGKIMRRLLRSVTKDEAITQDVSTLENSTIFDQLTLAH